MTEELRERLEKIKVMVNRAPLDFRDLKAIRMQKADCFDDLVSEIERLEEENERLEKERAQAADLLLSYTRAAASGDEDAESSAYWKLSYLLNPAVKATAKPEKGER